jgi:hypothetical protein
VGVATEGLRSGARNDLTAHVEALAALVRSGRHDDLLAPFAQAIVEDVEGLDGDGLLADLRKASQDGQPHVAFAKTTSGQRLKGRISAITLADICQVVPVEVGDEQALWIYSEFLTRADFDTLRDWVLPENWPQRGPGFFTVMNEVDGTREDLSEVGPAGDQHWTAVYREQVDLKVCTLDTDLRCNYFERTGKFAATTYELVRSYPDEAGGRPPLVVDRGYLSVGALRSGQFHVRALKVVGFSAEMLSGVAEMSCPLWTAFVKQAATAPGGAPPEADDRASEVLPPEEPAPGTGTSAEDLWAAVVDPESCGRRTGEVTSFYTRMVADAVPRAASGDYGWPDYTRDAMTAWTRMARDWASLWKQGADLVGRLADLEPTASTPRGSGTASRAAPGAGMFSGFEASASLTCSLPLEGAVLQPRALHSIGTPTASIPAARQRPRTTTVQGNKAVAVVADAVGVPTGLYIGDLLVEGDRGSTLVPVQVYVSGSVAAR